MSSSPASPPLMFAASATGTAGSSRERPATMQFVDAADAPATRCDCTDVPARVTRALKHAVAPLPSQDLAPAHA